MLTVYPAIKTAIRQGKIKLFGRCCTGVLGSDRFYRHAALVTERAFMKIEENPDLKTAVQDQIDSNSLTAESFAAPDLTARIYQWPTVKHPRITTFGVCLATRPEVRSFEQTQYALQDTAEGIHREIYFAMRGLKTSGLRDIPPGLYSKLIAMLECGAIADDINYIKIIDDTGQGSARGRRVLQAVKPGENVIYLSQLEKFGLITHPKFFCP